MRILAPFVCLLILSTLIAPIAGAKGFEDIEKQVKEYTLDNGLTFIVLERHDAPVFSFMTYVDAGSVDEMPGETGIAHMFEHMAFKGTPTIGTTDYEAELGAMKKVDEAEVMTTDNHIVNARVGGFNPIGQDDDHRLLNRLCNEVLDIALADLREAEAAATQVEASDVLVWGKGNTVRMTANLNASVSTSKAALLASIVIGGTIGFWAMWFI